MLLKLFYIGERKEKEMKGLHPSHKHQHTHRLAQQKWRWKHRQHCLQIAEFLHRCLSPGKKFTSQHRKAWRELLLLFIYIYTVVYLQVYYCLVCNSGLTAVGLLVGGVLYLMKSLMIASLFCSHKERWKALVILSALLSSCRSNIRSD